MKRSDILIVIDGYMKRKVALIILLISAGFVSAQTETELFPDKLNIQPFTANTLEPKLGFVFQLNENKLDLNIGNSMDIIHWKDGYSNYTIGADLFTYTLLRKEENFHFPVDAVDYLFGINFSYKKQVHNYSFGFRGRISHISAHFVDGHFDNTNDQWMNGLSPMVYSREFIELMPFYEFNNFRAYFGGTYNFHIDPSRLGKANFQVGFDYFMKNKISEVATPFLGYDCRIVKVNAFYSANNSLNCGIKFGKAEGKGLSIYYQYYSGNDLHGEYVDFKSTYSSLGINLDL
jgi:hypothetical protein